MQQLEQEVKLDADPGWSVPDLAGVLPGVQAFALPDLALEATYYDTNDLHLARQKMTLRFRRETALPAQEGPAPDERLVPEEGPVPEEGLAPEQRVAASEGSRRQGETTGIWTLKLPVPSDSAVLSRTEVTWPGGNQPGRVKSRTGAQRGLVTGNGRPRRSQRPREYEPVPAEVADFVQAITIGHPLQPVAHLSTTRRRTELRTSDGRRLAEVDQDSVTGTDLLSRHELHASEDGYADVRFSEVEVELAEGSALEVLDAVVDRLEKAGAWRSSRKSKLATVLALGRGGQAERNGAGPVKPRPGMAMAEVLQEQARACLDTVLGHDPAIRLEDPDPEHIHRSRVAARRLRTVFRAFAALITGPPENAVEGGAAPVAGSAVDVDLDLGADAATRPGQVGAGDTGDNATGDRAAQGNGTEKSAAASPESPERWFEELGQELKWLGGSLGTVRDSDVRLLSLEDDCADLEPADSAGSAVLLSRAKDDQRLSHEQLRGTMATGRYLELLQSLEAVASGPGSDLVPSDFWSLLSEPAAEGVPSLAQRQWRRLYKAVGRLGDKPSDDDLHRVRIQTKRLRYLADVASSVMPSEANRRAASRTAKAATALQDVLGDLHDAVVTEQWLRETAALAPTGTDTAVLVATGVAAGQLIAGARVRQSTQRAAWPAEWEQLDRKRLRTWVTRAQ